jgi:hypothetical protein
MERFFSSLKTERTVRKTYMHNIIEMRLWLSEPT